jgi:hypothetical protein
MIRSSGEHKKGLLLQTKTYLIQIVKIGAIVPKRIVGKVVNLTIVTVVIVIILLQFIRITKGLYGKACYFCAICRYKRYQRCGDTKMITNILARIQMSHEKIQKPWLFGNQVLQF